MNRLAIAAAVLGLVRRALAVPPPRPSSRAARLAALPLDGAPVRAPVAIRWDAHMVPFIEAQHDDDLAAALGVVHAHLRLGQMELMRRIAQGRIAEAVGPAGVVLDRTLRLFGFPRIAEEIVAALPDSTRIWAEAFVRGVNHVQRHAPPPHELELLGIAPEPWTVHDLFTIARIAATDVSWLVFGRLLRARAGVSPAAWQAIWPRLLDAGAPPAWPPGPEAGGEEALAEEALARAARAGSNSAAVAARRSASGGAMIASDPHLGLALPNLWLIAGMRSPGYHAVGLMLAGFPFVALGRNECIAWGGTSLHAASSELFDASHLPITERTETVRVRGRRPRSVKLRESPLGPIVSDGLILKHDRPLALRWVGQKPSDELGAMLAVMRARDWPEFRGALQGFAVPGQTMVYAGADGVGRVTAAHLPRRSTQPPQDLISVAQDAWPLDDLADASQLPAVFDPREGFVVSANERPPTGPVPVGHFFSGGERAERMRALLGGDAPLTSHTLRALQCDVMQPGSLTLRDMLLARAPPLRPDVVAVLRGWNGSYTEDSCGALAFEVMLARLARALHAPAALAPYNAVWTTRRLLAQDLAALPQARLQQVLAEALGAAGRALRRYRNWGNMHRLPVAHQLARLPLVGRRYRVGEYPSPGGADTLHKTAVPLTGRRHCFGFGSCARHVSDLADPDANDFVLVGGQDGWIGSECFADQMTLWRAGEYVRVPMRAESVHSLFRDVTVLRPEA